MLRRWLNRWVRWEFRGFRSWTWVELWRQIAARERYAAAMRETIDAGDIVAYGTDQQVYRVRAVSSGGSLEDPSAPTRLWLVPLRGGATVFASPHEVTLIGLRPHNDILKITRHRSGGEA